MKRRFNYQNIIIKSTAEKLSRQKGRKVFFYSALELVSAITKPRSEDQLQFAQNTKSPKFIKNN